MSGALKAVTFGLVIGTVLELLLLWIGVPPLAAAVLVTVICLMAGFSFGAQDRKRAA